MVLHFNYTFTHDQHDDIEFSSTGLKFWNNRTVILKFDKSGPGESGTHDLSNASYFLSEGNYGKRNTYWSNPTRSIFPFSCSLACRPPSEVETQHYTLFDQDFKSILIEYTTYTCYLTTALTFSPLSEWAIQSVNSILSKRHSMVHPHSKTLFSLLSLLWTVTSCCYGSCWYCTWRRLSPAILPSSSRVVVIAVSNLLVSENSARNCLPLSVIVYVLSNLL